MALAIADAGADVVLVGRDLTSLEKTAADIRALGRNAWTIQGDAGVPTECERICRTALDDVAPIDILINNVGGRRVNVPTQDMPLDTWRQMLNLNLTSTFLCTKLIGGAMVTRGTGGRIINLASINALVANRGIAGRHYETAKAAVLQFTRATAAAGNPPRKGPWQAPLPVSSAEIPRVCPPASPRWRAHSGDRERDRRAGRWRGDNFLWQRMHSSSGDGSGRTRIEFAGPGHPPPWPSKTPAADRGGEEGREAPGAENKLPHGRPEGHGNQPPVP